QSVAPAPAPPRRAPRPWAHCAVPGDRSRCPDTPHAPGPAPVADLARHNPPAPRRFPAKRSSRAWISSQLSQLLPQTLDLPIDLGDLGPALLVERSCFGQTRIQLGLLGEHARLAIALVLHRDMGASQLLLGQSQLANLLCHADSPCLNHHLLGQLQLLGGHRIVNTAAKCE